MMKSKTGKNKGMALVVVILIGLVLGLIGFGLLQLAEMEYSLTHKDVRKAKAFYLAEAGIANFEAVNTGERIADIEDIAETSFEGGSYEVDVFADEGYAIATGIVGSEQKRIRVEFSYLASPYEHAIFGGNASGNDWTLDLRGKNNLRRVGRTETGGIDEVYGNVYADGDVAMYEESRVYPENSENYDINGDVKATETVDYSKNKNGRAAISGAVESGINPLLIPDLNDMNYQENNTHNVSQIFANEGINSGRLPAGNELRNIFVKNPSGMSGECASTSGDDYFLEPASGIIEGNWTNATTPLDVGEGRVYYIDGDVWIHSNVTYGFLVNGTATIIATGDIHICDNVAYASTGSEGDMLGFVALGEYDSSGNLISGGNVYFGDPRYGTTYTFDGMMFAANDFLYNTSNIDRRDAEPLTGFDVYGNFVGLNHVTVNRDWYSPRSGGKARPAVFDPSIGANGSWVDVETRALLTQNEILNMRHYRMKVEYDERVRDVKTQPPGLPRGPGDIFNGITFWEELPSL
jgi:hypothetical protein